MMSLTDLLQLLKLPTYWCYCSDGFVHRRIELQFLQTRRSRADSGLSVQCRLGLRRQSTYQWQPFHRRRCRHCRLSSWRCLSQVPQTRGMLLVLRYSVIYTANHWLSVSHSISILPCLDMYLFRVIVTETAANILANAVHVITLNDKVILYVSIIYLLIL